MRRSKAKLALPSSQQTVGETLIDRADRTRFHSCDRFSNGLPGLATAFADRSPIFVITSSPPLRDAETNTLQGFHDQVVVAKNVTKFAHRVTNAGEIPRLVSLGWRTTTAGAPGPVLLDFPIDVLFTPIVEEDISWGSVLAPQVSLPGPDPTAIDNALSLWKAAKRPIMIVSTGAARVSGLDGPFVLTCSP